MKFGLESEKFIFDLRGKKPSDGVYHFIDALYESLPEESQERQVTNEFVLNMLEIVTKSSTSPRRILKDYLLHYLLITGIARREGVAIVPLASLPMDYVPHIIPKWAFLVQNCILSGKRLGSWEMDRSSPLRAGGNCCGVHIHGEVQTPREYLFSGRELMDKFNLGLMLTPMIGFASSPFFFGEHQAHSMRGRRYYQEIYRNFPLIGGLAPVMNSSTEVLLYFKEGTDDWIRKGTEVGFTQQEMVKHTGEKGANWSPLRWNKKWNTIELRCIESDRIDLDAAKFIWVYGCMKRLDIHGENLKCEVLSSELSLEELLAEAFRVEEDRVKILPTWAIKEVFERAILFGLEDAVVSQYLQGLGEFALGGISENYFWLFHILQDRLERRETTSSHLLRSFGEEVTRENSLKIVDAAIQDERAILDSFLLHYPDITDVLGRVDSQHWQ